MFAVPVHYLASGGGGGEEVEIFYDCNCSGALILSRLQWVSDSLPTAQSWFVSRDLSLSPQISSRQELGEQIGLSAVTCLHYREHRSRESFQFFFTVELGTSLTSIHI